MKNFKAKMTAFLVSVVTLMSAQVQIVKDPLPLNGDFSAGGWQNVPEQTDFSICRSKTAGKTKPDAQTRFKVAADADYLYVSILCHEDKVEKLKKTGGTADLWVTDTAELFLCPTGQHDEFYQFVVSSSKICYSMFYGETGMIRPDPYQPFWDSKVFYGKDYWLVQLRIPFSAFYMTRNGRWASEWLLNVARSRTPFRELSSWSPVKGGNFRDSRSFRKFRGFPQRDPAQDIAIRKVSPDIQNYIDNVYSGPLHLTIEANPAAAGKYELKVEEPEGKSSVHAIVLKSGLNRVTLPNVEYLKKAQGKTDLKLTLKSLKNGFIFGRYFPIDIVFQPIRMTFYTPGYKQNFYPGQDYSAIRGELKLRLSAKQKKSAKVVLSISGGGLAEKKLSFNADQESIPFEFDSRKLQEGGETQITAQIMDGGKELTSCSSRIRRLKKNTGSMVWIENGVIIKNGKPWYPRFIYAAGYRGGTAFAERYKADDLAESRFYMTTLEPGRLIRGIEAEEATKDVKPRQELLAKIQTRVEQMRNNPNFDFYYISDEPEYRNISPVYLKYIYDFVSKLDPYHPILTCCQEADKYLDCADIFSPHPYLNPLTTGGKRIYQRPVHQVRKSLQNVTKVNRPDKVVGFTGGFYCGKWMNILLDYLTWEELESMSWCAIAQGSRFQYPYAYHDLGDRPVFYEGYRYFNQSILALESLLLSNRKHPVKAVDPENMIDTLLVEDGDATLLVVVNLKNGPLETEISAEHLKQFKTMLEFRGAGTKEIINGTLKLSLKPYECVVLTSKKLDGGLKTREEVLEEIAAADRARASRGNLLFEKEKTFQIDSSTPRDSWQTYYKLCDGVIDMLGWASKDGAKEIWYELHFRKNPPKFSKIGIYGLFGGAPVVKIWKFGEWKELVPKDVKMGKYSAVLDFGEELKSVKIHFDFKTAPKAKSVELYEIELLK